LGPHDLRPLKVTGFEVVDTGEQYRWRDYSRNESARRTITGERTRKLARRMPMHPRQLFIVTMVATLSPTATAHTPLKVGVRSCEPEKRKPLSKKLDPTASKWRALARTKAARKQLASGCRNAIRRAARTMKKTDGRTRHKATGLRDKAKSDAPNRRFRKLVWSAWRRRDLRSSIELGSYYLAIDPQNGEILAVVGVAACMLGRVAIAKRAYAQMGAPRQAMLRARCEKSGITLP
jgi:membrane carboxypeptidase/penicillin-binding protein